MNYLNGGLLLFFKDDVAQRAQRFAEELEMLVFCEECAVSSVPVTNLQVTLEFDEWRGAIEAVLGEQTA